MYTPFLSESTYRMSPTQKLRKKKTIGVGGAVFFSIWDTKIKLSSTTCCSPIGFDVWEKTKRYIIKLSVREIHILMLMATTRDIFHIEVDSKLKSFVTKIIIKQMGFVIKSNRNQLPQSPQSPRSRDFPHTHRPFFIIYFRSMSLFEFRFDISRTLSISVRMSHIPHVRHYSFIYIATMEVILSH